jgi:fibro-slime domain-containing protein
VTYFDYHVDGSNPDFGFRSTARWEFPDTNRFVNYRGWADSTLTADKSPKRNPALTNPFLNISWNLAKLFKPSVAGVKDTFVWKTPDSLVFEDSLDDEGYVVKTDTTKIPMPDTIMVSDTMFKNIVIQDSLKFSWVPDTSTYDIDNDSTWQAGRSGGKDYPLNGKGFGAESDDNNCGYSMSLHNKIKYHGGEHFYVGADDDAYTFINGKLAIEDGGFHEQIPDSVALDSLHLTVEQQYDIDLFYIERRQGGNIYIKGISDFVNKGAIQIDTLYDTTYTPKEVGVIPHSAKSRFQKGTLYGINIPASSQNVKLEYFAVSGVKLATKEMSIVQATANAYVGLPKGVYVVRATFFNAQNKRLSTGFFSNINVRK